MMHATGLTETKIDANKCNHAGSEHALTAVTLEMAKASELSTAQLLAQPRSFLKLKFAFFFLARKYISQWLVSVSTVQTSLNQEFLCT